MPTWTRIASSMMLVVTAWSWYVFTITSPVETFSLLISDLILAAQLFNDLQFHSIGDIVWLTYGPAQMLIVFAVNSALLVIGR